MDLIALSGLIGVCVCVCVLPSILQGSSGHPSQRLGYVSPAPQAISKDLVIIHSRGSTWGDLFRGLFILMSILQINLPNNHK